MSKLELELEGTKVKHTIKAIVDYLKEHQNGCFIAEEILLKTHELNGVVYVDNKLLHHSLGREREKAMIEGWTKEIEEIMSKT